MNPLTIVEIGSGVTFVITVAIVLWVVIPRYFTQWSDKCNKKRQIVTKLNDDLRRECRELRQQLSIYQKLNSTRYKSRYVVAAERWAIAQRICTAATKSLRSLRFPVSIASSLNSWVYTRFLIHAVSVMYIGYQKLARIENDIHQIALPGIKEVRSNLKQLEKIPDEMLNSVHKWENDRIPFIESLIKNSERAYLFKNEDLVKFRQIKKTATTVNYHLQDQTILNLQKVDKQAVDLEQNERDLLEFESRVSDIYNDFLAVGKQIDEVVKESKRKIDIISEKGHLNYYSPLIFHASSELSVAVQLHRTTRFEAALEKLWFSKSLIKLVFTLFQTQNKLEELENVRETSLLDPKSVIRIQNKFQSIYNKACTELNSKVMVEELQQDILNLYSGTAKMLRYHYLQVNLLELVARIIVWLIERERIGLRKKIEIVDDPVIQGVRYLNTQLDQSLGKPVLLLRFNKEAIRYTFRVRKFRRAVEERIRDAEELMQKLEFISNQANKVSTKWRCLSTRLSAIIPLKIQADNEFQSLYTRKDYLSVDQSIQRLLVLLRRSKGVYKDVEEDYLNLTKMEDWLITFTTFLNENPSSLNLTRRYIDQIHEGIDIARRESSLNDTLAQLRRLFDFALDCIRSLRINTDGKYILLIQSGATVYGVSQGDFSTVNQYFQNPFM